MEDVSSASSVAQMPQVLQGHSHQRSDHCEDLCFIACLKAHFPENSQPTILFLVLGFLLFLLFFLSLWLVLVVDLEGSHLCCGSMRARV